MIKVILILTLFLNLFYCFQYDLNLKKNFYIIDNDNVVPVKIEIVKTFLLDLIDLQPYFGYINNFCIQSYSCCSINGSLIKQIPNKYCLNPISSCSKLYTNTSSQCIDTSQCESYNSITNIKYIFGFNENDIKCFFNFRKINTNIKINTSPLTNYSIFIEENDNKINDNFYIEGIVKYNLVNLYPYFSCQLPLYTNYILQDNLTLFNSFKNFLLSDNIDCKTMNINYSSIYIDKNFNLYNQLNKTYISLYDNYTKSIIYNSNSIINVKITNDVIIKEYNKGCLITNIENNEWNFYFELNCFEDTYKIIHFSLNYNDKTYEYMYEINENYFTFNLQSFRYPQSFSNIFGEKNIILNYQSTKRTINPQKIIEGDQNKPFIDINIPNFSNYIIGFIFIIILLVLIILILLKKPLWIDKLKTLIQTNLQNNIDSFKKIFENQITKEDLEEMNKEEEKRFEENSNYKPRLNDGKINSCNVDIKNKNENNYPLRGTSNIPHTNEKKKEKIRKKWEENNYGKDRLDPNPIEKNENNIQLDENDMETLIGK